MFAFLSILSFSSFVLPFDSLHCAYLSRRWTLKRLRVCEQSLGQFFFELPCVARRTCTVSLNLKWIWKPEAKNLMISSSSCQSVAAPSTCTVYQHLSVQVCEVILISAMEKSYSMHILFMLFILPFGAQLKCKKLGIHAFARHSQ